jgi:hypothetical protein
MSRGIQMFKQTDIAKALKAAQSAGLDVQRFEIDKAGTIVVIAASRVVSERIKADAQ